MANYESYKETQIVIIPLDKHNSIVDATKKEIALSSDIPILNPRKYDFLA